MINKLCSSRGQISMEFSILMLVVITAATIVGYHMLKSAVDVRDMNVNTINKSANITITALEKVD